MKYVKKSGPEAWEDHIYEEEHFTWIVKRTLIHLGIFISSTKVVE